MENGMPVADSSVISGYHAHSISSATKHLTFSIQKGYDCYHSAARKTVTEFGKID